MKTRFRLQVLVVAALCITFLTQSCVKEPFKPGTNSNGIPQDPNGLPTYSEVGRGTFGFLLDGKAWLPGCSSWIDPSGAELYVDRAQINARNDCRPKWQKLHMTMPPFSEGVFGLDDMGFDAYYIDYETGKNYICSLKDSQNTNFTIQHYDAEKQIMSGTFQLVMYGPKPGQQVQIYSKLADRDTFLNYSDSIIIKDGRFDVVHR
jgi:hypothetical protein